MTMTRMSNDPPYHFRAHLFVCTNRRPPDHPHGSCAALGSQDLVEAMRKMAKEEFALEDIRVNNAGCLGRCDKGPVLVVYPEGVWYSVKTPEDMREVLTAHVIDGGRCERLMVPAA